MPDYVNKSVLIVDDDSDLLYLYKQAFENATFEVDDSQTIEKAEKLIAEKKYDVILLDILFPSNDIFTTLQNIRAKGSVNEKTPVLVLTNLESGDKTKKALEFGANECLFKATQTPKSIFEAAIKLVNEVANEPQTN